jgi:hypothetical protein
MGGTWLNIFIKIRGMPAAMLATPRADHLANADSDPTDEPETAGNDR